jgi:predicted TIM-barrel fold metal-dependent hydrolase
VDLLPVVDTHHHLWDLTHHRYPWLEDPLQEMWIGDYRSLQRNYLVADYLADCGRQNVVKSVHLQAMWDPKNPVGESRWLQRCFDETGYPAGIVGFANLADPSLNDLLRAHREYPNVRGIRQDLNWHENPLYRFCERPDYMVDAQWLRGFALLEKYGFSFDLQLYAAYQSDQAEPLVRGFPGTQFILNHSGLPMDKSEAGLARWRQGLERLAQYPNVAVKLSGFDMFDHRYTVDSLRAPILDVIGIFGIDRCMFASNFPVSGLYGSYDQLFEAYKAIVSPLPGAAQRKVFHDNAVRIYRLG